MAVRIVSHAIPGTRGNRLDQPSPASATATNGCREPSRGHLRDAPLVHEGRLYQAQATGRRPLEAPGRPLHGLRSREPEGRRGTRPGPHRSTRGRHVTVIKPVAAVQGTLPHRPPQRFRAALESRANRPHGPLPCSAIRHAPVHSGRQRFVTGHDGCHPATASSRPLVRAGPR